MAESTVEARDLWQAALERLRHEGQTYVVSQLLQLRLVPRGARMTRLAS